MMKKMMCAVALTLVFLMMLGCVPTTGGSSSSGTGAMKISEYLADDEMYQEAAKRMEEDDLPNMRFFCQLVLDEIHDQETIRDFWYRLGEVGIYPNRSVKKEILDADVCFYFQWEDGTKVTIAFASSEYYKAGDKLAPTENPDTVRSISRDIMEAWKSEEAGIDVEPADGKVIEVTTKGPFISFDWDLDGDGEDENFDGRFHDNGDEAPSVIEVSCWFNGADQTVWIDRAYGIVGAVEKEDAEQGRYLELEYYIGDYYGHDNTEFCYLFLNEAGELDIAGEYID